MGKTVLWISYDLGVSGDYEGLYAWLASHNAEECGDSLAYLPSYEFEGDIEETLRKDLAKAVTFGKRARIYVIFKKSTGSPKGKFLYGGRRQAPWHGYAPGSAGGADDEG